MVSAVSSDPGTWFTLSDEDEQKILTDISANPKLEENHKNKYEIIRVDLLDSASKFRDRAWEEVKACWAEFASLKLTSVDDRFAVAYKYDLRGAKCKAQAERIKSAFLEREKADFLDKADWIDIDTSDDVVCVDEMEIWP